MIARRQLLIKFRAWILKQELQNKETEPIVDPNKAKKRANREVQYQRILSYSNSNNRSTYPIPATANNATSASIKRRRV